MHSLLRKILSFKRTIHSAYQLRRIRHRGKNNGVFGKIDIIAPKNITIGNNCIFNHGVYINGFNNIEIGDDVTFSAKVCVTSTGIDYTSWKNGIRCHERNEGIKIGSHVWIGANALILPNVHINGEYVVIASGAVVTKDINESKCIYAGCPARLLKYIE